MTHLLCILIAFEKTEADTLRLGNSAEGSRTSERGSTIREMTQNDISLRREAGGQLASKRVRRQDLYPGSLQSFEKRGVRAFERNLHDQDSGRADGARGSDGGAAVSDQLGHNDVEPLSCFRTDVTRGIIAIAWTCIASVARLLNPPFGQDPVGEGADVDSTGRGSRRGGEGGTFSSIVSSGDKDSYALGYGGIDGDLDGGGAPTVRRAEADVDDVSAVGDSFRDSCDDL